MESWIRSGRRVWILMFSVTGTITRRNCRVCRGICRRQIDNRRTLGICRKRNFAFREFLVNRRLSSSVYLESVFAFFPHRGNGNERSFSKPRKIGANRRERVVMHWLILTETGFEGLIFRSFSVFFRYFVIKSFRNLLNFSVERERNGVSRR